MAKPNSVVSRDIAYHLHPYTHLGQHELAGPMLLREGRGIHVRDESGREYIDGLAGLWCVALGYGEERLVAAAAEQMSRLAFCSNFAGRGTEVAADLAEALVEMAPAPMAKAFFVNSGSEANDTQIKLVWYYNNIRGRPEKKKIIARRRGYHGVTVAASSLTGLGYVQDGFDVPIDRILHTECPHFWRQAEPGESEAGFASRMAEDLERLIMAEGPETVAAFIAEPVMGAGGVITPPVTYFEKVQNVLDKHDVLFIVDEVITGFGRLGDMFGCETYGLRPDLMTLAKGLSSAYVPIGAVLISDDIYRVLRDGSDKYGVFGHGYTYSGHPVAAAVAREALRIYRERDMAGHVRAIAPRFQDGLRAFADHPIVGEVRGRGLIAGVELVADKAGKSPFPAEAKVGRHLEERALAGGLIVRALAGDTIALCPPLIVDEDDVDEILSRFGKALGETLEHVRDAGLV
ncbi:MAG: aminotransferase [Alphaproteobacteria bacterium]